MAQNEKKPGGELPGQPNHAGFANGDNAANAPVARFITPGGHPIDNSQPAFPVFHRKIANPAPLGLSAFAATTFTLSMYNVQARGIMVPNVVVGLALGYGGLVQLLAGMWEFACGNTFGATAFSSYGGFWLSYAALLIPWTGIGAAYEEDSKMMANAIGVYLTAWFIFSLLMLVASLRSSGGLVAVFFFLVITFILLLSGEFTGKVVVTKAGGVFGLITAFLAWYVALAGLLTPDTSFFTLPTLDLSKKN